MEDESKNQYPSSLIDQHIVVLVHLRLVDFSAYAKEEMETKEAKEESEMEVARFQTSIAAMPNFLHGLTNARHLSHNMQERPSLCSSWFATVPSSTPTTNLGVEFDRRVPPLPRQ